MRRSAQVMSIEGTALLGFRAFFFAGIEAIVGGSMFRLPRFVVMDPSSSPIKGLLNKFVSQTSPRLT